MDARIATFRPEYISLEFFLRRGWDCRRACACGAFAQGTHIQDGALLQGHYAWTCPSFPSQAAIGEDGHKEALDDLGWRRRCQPEGCGCHADPGRTYGCSR